MKNLKPFATLALSTTSFITMSILSLGSAAPVTFAIDDSSFDYTNTATSIAYINLDYQDGEMLVKLSDHASNIDLAAISVTVPDLGKVDFFGNTIGAELSDISEIDMIDYGALSKGFEVLHPNLKLNEVVSLYTKELAQLGFDSVTVESSGGSYEIDILSNGSHKIRAVFKASSDGVSARLYGLL